MIAQILKNQEEHGNKSLEALKRDFGTLRSGKVNIAILDHITVDYYGTPTPLNQVATVLATDASTIAITPWEKKMLKDITSALAAANLGVNPTNDGECVKLFFPPMTKEDREKSAKEAKAMGEKAKVSVRNVRKEANDEIKKIEKDKSMGEDEIKRGYDDVQKLTDKFIEKIDEIIANKESELMKI